MTPEERKKWEAMGKRYLEAQQAQEEEDKKRTEGDRKSVV